MPPVFRFRLKPVLELRERTEQQRASEHAAALDAQLAAERARDGFILRRDRLREELVREHGGLDVATLRATYAHLDYLDRAIIDADVRVAECIRETETARLTLVEAAKERKVLETLRERRREAHDEEAALVEHRELDDMNARIFDRAALEGTVT